MNWTFNKMSLSIEDDKKIAQLNNFIPLENLVIQFNTMNYEEKMMELT